jgi:hypothetical protein
MSFRANSLPIPRATASAARSLACGDVRDSIPAMIPF